MGKKRAYRPQLFSGGVFTLLIDFSGFKINIGKRVCILCMFALVSGCGGWMATLDGNATLFDTMNVNNRRSWIGVVGRREMMSTVLSPHHTHFGI